MEAQDSLDDGKFFRDQEFNNENLPKLYGTRFDNCTFKNTSLPIIDDVIFGDCTFQIVMFGPTLNESSIISNVKFHSCKFKTSFFAVTSIQNCNFHDCSFDDLTIGQSVVLDRSFFMFSKNFHEIKGLERLEFHDNIIYIRNFDSTLVKRTNPLPLILRFGSWARVRSIGALPLFGISFSALVAIPAVMSMIALYNSQVHRFTEWSKSHALSNQPDAAEALQEIIARLHPLPIPSLTLWLGISTIMLGAASLSYNLFCPDRIKQFTEEQWSNEVRRPLLQYLPFSWRKPYLSAATLFLYVVGGGLSLIILLIKMAHSLAFIWLNSHLAWYAL
ncbi:hypothetical protein [Roseicella sp. DB1501]|uniref:hypothetical protein n=1 Tax=Roseicella sp. DB1501 TaxID=2730925 RepID=UPI001492528B|nr:hypothetical protein [Roseicella sp. DB1501]NOG69796.1 hypothetical protein [Roseicella sp. DB1501]